MMRQAKVYNKGIEAGLLTEDADGYVFRYADSYLQREDREPVSLTLPLRAEKYRSQTMFSFFDGLIPEGWLLEITTRNWKLSPNDRMGLLMTCCRDCIGAVSVVGVEGEEDA